MTVQDLITRLLAYPRHAEVTYSTEDGWEDLTDSDIYPDEDDFGIIRIG